MKSKTFVTTWRCIKHGHDGTIEQAKMPWMEAESEK